MLPVNGLAAGPEATAGPAALPARPVLETAGLTVPPGQALPDDGTCADRVVDTAEIRPQNTSFNQTRGTRKDVPTQYLAPSIGAHLSGDFVGTTDEIIQWAACKWGIEADVVRAQAAQESSWFMTSTGDYTTDSTWCAPGHSPGSDGRSGCPESVGLMGDKYRYHEIAFPEAGQSTAHNLDYALAVWRDCFEGNQTWLGDDNSGYHAGDMWGCVGRWYAAAWRDGMASGYISRVQAKYNDRVWETGAFKSLSSPASSG